MHFGEKIRSLRKAQNMSQTTLAKSLNVSRRTVCSWETEGRFPKERHIINSLAGILDCPVEYLLTDQPGLVSDVYEKFGNSRSLISKNILLDVQAYFTSTYISQEEKDTFMFAIHESYIEARKAKAIDVTTPDARDTQKELPFKGIRIALSIHFPPLKFF